MDLQSNYLNKNRFVLYLSFFVLILQRLFFPIYELTPIIETILLLILIIVTIDTKYLKTNRSFKQYIFFCILLYFFIYAGRYAHTGLGSIQTLVLFFLYYLLPIQLKLKNNDYKIIKYSSIIVLILLYWANLSSYNTNSAAFSFFIFGIYSTLFIPVDKKKNLLLLFSLSLFTIYNIYLYDSRTAIGAFICYLFFRLIPVNVYKNRMLLLFFLILLTIGNLLYVFFYINLYMNDFDLPILKELSNKKLFSGRQLIWIEVLNYFSKYPWTGIGSKIHLSSHDNVNLHNSMLMFFAVYGSIIGSLILGFIYKLILPLSEYSENQIVKSCLAAYLSFLIVGFSETSLISASFACVFPICIAYSIKNN